LQVEVSYSLHVRTLGLVFSYLGGMPKGGESHSDDEDGTEEPRRHLAESCRSLDVCVVASERRSSLLSFISRRSHGDNYKVLTIMMHKTVQLLLLTTLLESRLLLWYNTAVAIS